MKKLLGCTRRELMAGMAALPFQVAAQTTAAKGAIPVAFLISDNAELIDFAGPWSFFANAVIPGRTRAAPGFKLYTVGPDKNAIQATGMQVLPDYTFENAPPPKIIVIGAQSGSDAMLAWIKKQAPSADLTMSVCTGAFHLAETGLLNGKAATTHHGSYGRFGMKYGREIRLKRGARFVDEGNIASSGGLTSGIDLTLHAIERFYGRKAAEDTAYYMEYQGEGWKDAGGASNTLYGTTRPGDCPVCGMPAQASGLSMSYQGKTFYFCSSPCKSNFESSPERFLA